MQELFILSAILCFVTEGAPFTRDRSSVTKEVQTILVDLGANLTLSCGGLRGREVGPVMWVRDGRDLGITRNQIQRDGSIFFPSLQQSDSGLYSCRQEDTDDSDSHSSLTNEDSFEARVRICVRTPPHVLKNITVLPSTIAALVTWEINDVGDSGYPILNFTLTYRLKNATDNDWKVCPPKYISPHTRLFNVFPLHPNSTYLFQMWANNQLGRGNSTIVEGSTLNDLQEIELGKHLLDGIDTFDVRIWIIAVAVVISTLFILGIATCCLFYKEYSSNYGDSRDLDGESIELMPNIILNPGYDFQSMEMSEPDENSNDTTPLRVNNNSVIFPARV